MPPEPCLSVVMPCFNEATTVLEVVKVVLESPWVNEVVIVDDGSTDGTRDLLATIDHDQVTILLHEENQGKGAALRTGFSRATQPYVIVQDADLEYDPADYGRLRAKSSHAEPKPTQTEPTCAKSNQIANNPVLICLS